MKSLPSNANYSCRRIPEIKSRGFFLAIIGPDGSGKTSVAETLSKSLESHFDQVPMYIHGDFDILPRLKSLRKIWAKIKRREMPPDPDYTKKHAGAAAVPHSLVRSLGYVCYYYWGYLLGHFTILLAKANNKIIIADRYFYDYFFLRDSMRIPHWLLRLLIYFIPRPDLIVFLDADAEEIYARKNELTIEEIKRQQDIIRKICKWLPNYIAIDTHKGISQTVEQVKAAIFTKIVKKNK